MDADVIKAYVELGMGVGLVASIAFDPERDLALHGVDAGALFGINVTQLAIKRGSFLRGYTYAFIESFAPGLDAQAVDRAMADA
jgi:LysR family cys regulon transcriptional activator